MKRTNFLVDEPSVVDEIGSHRSIAKQLGEIITAEAIGHSVAILGDWGSGKSTILNLMVDELSPSKGDDAPKTSGGVDLQLFMYDAWAHQGDPLRRSFLDDLMAALKLGESARTRLRRRIWNTDEETRTTSETVLRPHAKVLALLLALLPLSWAFLEVPAGNSSLASLFCYPRNWVAVGLMLPFLLYASFCWWVAKYGKPGLQDRVLGARDDGAEEDAPVQRPSLTSLIFQRVTGHVERKHTRSPADSVSEFRRVFKDALAAARSERPNLKLVIVVDNIDRLSGDHAREFWATMQTFFGDSGGLRERLERTGDLPIDPGYWLVTPFAPSVVAQAFGLPAQDVQAFIDKTFWLSLIVPPPITGSWRSFFIAQLRRAFPEHSSYELADVRELVDLSLSDGTSTPSPRALKLLVNSAVGIYRIHNGQIGLAPIAAYLLNKSKISGASIPEDMLSPAQMRICGPHWRTLLAAIHFGVSERDAAQLLLKDPIRKYVLEGSSDGLMALTIQPGFADALSRFIHLELFDAVERPLARIISAARAMGRVPSADFPDVDPLWHVLQDRLLSLSEWKEIESPVAEGLASLIDHADEKVVPELVSSIVSGLASIDVESLPGDESPSYSPRVSDWFTAAAVYIAPRIEGDRLIELPKSAWFTLNVLIGVAAEPLAVRSRILSSVPDAGLTDALTTKIAAGHLYGDMKPFHSLALERKSKIDWLAVLRAINARLQQSIDTTFEFDALFRLATSVLWSAGSPTLEMKALGLEKAIYPILSAKSPAQENAPILSTLLALDRPQKDDADFSTLMSSAGEELAGLLADLAVQHGTRTRTLRRFLADGAMPGLLLEVERVLIRRQERFTLSPEDFVTLLPAMRVGRDNLSIEEILTNTIEAGKLSHALIERGFDPGLSLLYASVMRANVSSPEFEAWLAKEIGALSAENWLSWLDGSSGEGAELLDAAAVLRERDRSFELKTSAADAAEKFLKAATVGASSSPDPQLLALLMTLLPRRKAGLSKRFFGWLQDQDQSTVLRGILLAAPTFPLPKGLSAERVLRSIAIPIIDGGSAEQHYWLLQSFEAGTFDPSKLSPESFEDLVSHVDSAQSKLPSASEVLATIGTRLANSV